MSEIINNREYRQKVLKELIMELHNGKPVEEVKAKFGKLIEGVSTAEIGQMEQNLIMEGMPVGEVQRLCDVHAAVFKGSIEEIHNGLSAEDSPGHPVHTFRLENREIEKLINERIKPDKEAFKNSETKENVLKLTEDFDLLWEVDKHYSRKENLLFPYLEKYGITAPPKVMWGVDDEIREGIKAIRRGLAEYEDSRDGIVLKIEDTINRITEMIFKEESILFPMALETLIQDEWKNIAGESKDIGYCLIGPEEEIPNKNNWVPQRDNPAGIGYESPGSIRLGTGVLSNMETDFMLRTLPFDITFIDKDDVVKYFSNGAERIFTRTEAVIGRKVQNCHPPSSVHIVEKMLEDFKAGIKDHEDFWINMGDMYVYIRYFAVRDEKNVYLGTMEVTQNIKPIQDIQGEKRLMS